MGDKPTKRQKLVLEVLAEAHPEKMTTTDIHERCEFERLERQLKLEGKTGTDSFVGNSRSTTHNRLLALESKGYIRHVNVGGTKFWCLTEAGVDWMAETIGRRERELSKLPNKWGRIRELRP